MGRQKPPPTSPAWARKSARCAIRRVARAARVAQLAEKTSRSMPHAKRYKFA
jgi:hypothetical protein